MVLKTAHRGYYIQTKNVNDLITTCTVDIHSWNNRELWCPAFRVSDIASATGSGDSSIAGFLAAFLNGRPIDNALKYANCVGYQNLHELDAVSGIKTWAETTDLIEKDELEMITIQLNTHNWKWEKRMKMWVGAKDINFKG